MACWQSCMHVLLVTEEEEASHAKETEKRTSRQSFSRKGRSTVLWGTAYVPQSLVVLRCYWPLHRARRTSSTNPTHLKSPRTPITCSTSLTLTRRRLAVRITVFYQSNGGHMESFAMEISLAIINLRLYSWFSMFSVWDVHVCVLC